LVHREASVSDEDETNRIPILFYNWLRNYHCYWLSLGYYRLVSDLGFRNIPRICNKVQWTTLYNYIVSYIFYFIAMDCAMQTARYNFWDLIILSKWNAKLAKFYSILLICSEKVQDRAYMHKVLVMNTLYLISGVS